MYLPSPSQRLDHIALGGPCALLGWLAWGSRSPAGCVGRGTPPFSRGPCAGSPPGPAGPKPTLGATQLFARSQAGPGTPHLWVLPDAPAWDTPLLRTAQAWGRLWVQAPVPALNPLSGGRGPRVGGPPREGPPNPVAPQTAVSTQTGRHGRLCSQLPDCVTGLTVFFFLFNLQPENLQKNWLREFYQVRAGRQSAHVREQLRLLEAQVCPAAPLSSEGRGSPRHGEGGGGPHQAEGGASHFLVPPRRPLPSQMPPRLGLCLSAGTFMRTWVQDGGSEACVCP